MSMLGVTEALCSHAVEQACGAAPLSAVRRLVPLYRAALRLEVSVDRASDDNAVGASSTEIIVRRGVLCAATSGTF